MTGKVMKAIAEKRFGFIKGTDGAEYFFHQQDLNGFWDDLVKDMGEGRLIEVEFEVVPSTKGPRAAEVTRIDSGV